MKNAQTIALSLGNFILFIIVSILFVPAFFIVTLFQDFWSKKLTELFGL